jgi:ABC-type nickel/cobalt efflux system permease component RcnA
MNDDEKFVTKGCTFGLFGCAGAIIVLTIALALAVKLFKLISA